MALSRMVSPMYGHLTQSYRAGVHSGIDIGSNGEARAVYAAFAGEVVLTVAWAKPGNTVSTLAPERTGNGVVVRNVGPGSSGDGEYQIYNHVSPAVKTGMQIPAGALVGYLDDSGRQTGRHLHFETWTKNKRTYNPLLAFNRWGIGVGAVPHITGKPTVKPTTPKPVAPRVGSAKHREWQKRQNRFGNARLYVDGINGPRSRAWRVWVKDEAQRYLPGFRGVPKLTRDGDYGPKTHEAARILQKRNKLVVDGFVDTKTINYMRKYGSKIKHRPKTR